MAEATFTFGKDGTTMLGSTSSLDISVGPGKESGPRSIDLLLLALGGCSISTVGQYMRRKGLPAENLRLVLSSEVDEATNSYKEISVKVFVDDNVPEDQKQIISTVAKACRIHKTLVSPPDIRIDVCLAEDNEAV